MRLASISVDLDSLPHYCRIHGLDEGILDGRARQLVYSVALPRFLEAFQQAGVKATFFAVGEDLLDEECAAQLAQAAAAGHEVASHSFSHDYALSRLDPAQLAQDLAKADALIEKTTGQAPQGFRAPGYTLSSTLYQALIQRGYCYDSSAFPAAPYYLAKAAVMGALSLAGRPSRSVLDSPRVLAAPRQPYRPHPLHPYRRGDGAVLELPVTVTPLTRFPFIGTFALTLPLPLVRALYATLRQERHFNFELHGVDALDGSDGIPEALCRVQRDLKVASADKLSRLQGLLARIGQDYQPCTLAEAALRPGLV